MPEEPLGEDLPSDGCGGVGAEAALLHGDDDDDGFCGGAGGHVSGVPRVVLVAGDLGAAGGAVDLLGEVPEHVVRGAARLRRRRAKAGSDCVEVERIELWVVCRCWVDLPQHGPVGPLDRKSEVRGDDLASVGDRRVDDGEL